MAGDVLTVESTESKFVPTSSAKKLAKLTKFLISPPVVVADPDCALTLIPFKPIVVNCELETFTSLAPIVLPLVDKSSSSPTMIPYNPLKLYS